MNTHQPIDREQCTHGALKLVIGCTPTRCGTWCTLWRLYHIQSELREGGHAIRVEITTAIILVHDALRSISGPLPVCCRLAHHIRYGYGVVGTPFWWHWQRLWGWQPAFGIDLNCLFFGCEPVPSNKPFVNSTDCVD